MQITLVYAQNEQHAIGYKGNKPLPWHHPQDLARFVQLTRDKPIIMGMSTFESLPRVLPGRFHHVLTRKKSFISLGRQTNVMFHASLSDALAVCMADEASEVCLIGGSSVLEEGIGLADVIHRTVIANHPLAGELTYAPQITDAFECYSQVVCESNRNLTFQIFTRHNKGI